MAYVTQSLRQSLGWGCRGISQSALKEQNLGVKGMGSGASQLEVWVTSQHGCSPRPPLLDTSR